MLYRSISGVMKTTAVIISAGGEDNFFQSVADVPEGLRRQLVESTEGENSGTIVIADRAGKERISRERPDKSKPVPTRLAPAPEPREVEAALAHLSLPEPSEPASPARLSWLAWAGFLLVLAGAGAFAAFLGMRW